MRIKGKEQGIKENIDDNNKEQEVRKSRFHTKRMVVVAAFIPFIVLAVMIFLLFSPTFQSFINSGIPLPDVAIEKIEFRENPSQIIAFIRNSGPTEITIAQADVNDRIHA